MDFTFSRKLTGSVSEIAQRVRDVLKTEGFGILTEIDLAATLKAKIGAEMAPYIILGACNPPLAKLALEAEPRVGVMLPCNVIVRESKVGETEVSAINPAAPMSAIGNPKLEPIAREVGQRLSRVIARL